MQPRTKKILIAAGVFTVLSVIGIVTGVVVSENKRKSSRNSVATAHTTGFSTSTTDNPHTVDPNGDNQEDDDSESDNDGPSFELDPALHKSFYGIAYTPYGAIPPECGATLANVTKDMEKLSQLTPRLRLYGSDCNVTALVLQAIEDLDVDVDIFPGIFLETEEESYLRQKTVLEQTLTNFGTSHVLGVSVGNEYVLMAGSRGETTEAATARLVEKMNEVRTDLTALGFELDVGTSDAGGTVPQVVADAADYVFANIHPWFSSTPVEQAAVWTEQFMDDIIEPLAVLSPRTPDMYQGEIGWPSASDDVATNAGGSLAGIPELQLVLDDWVCPMNAKGKRYFWFSAFDEEWKSINGGVEAHWGLFNQDGTLKDITIPNCPLDD